MGQVSIDTVKYCPECGNQLEMLQQADGCTKINLWLCRSCSACYRRVTALEKVPANKMIATLLLRKEE